MLTDLRFGFRTLRKAPVFTVSVLLALAFCIGINAAIFSIVDTALFRPLAFPDQDRLVSATEGVPGLGYPVLPFSCPDYLFVAANNRSFAATGTYRTQEYEISGAGRPRRVIGARFTASMFQVLGIAPAVGRTFSPQEDDHAARVAVLTDGFARTLFATPQQALGRVIRLNRIPYQVIGVMPPSFAFPIRGSRFNDDPAGFFVPVSWSKDDRIQTVANFDHSMLARLLPGVSIAEARADVAVLSKRIVDDYPPNMKAMIRRVSNFSLVLHVTPFREEFTGDVKRPLLLMMAAVGLVLLIGCADIANLMFSRMIRREREFALRRALGAGFWRLARQTLVEGLLLSAVGGALGFFLAFRAVPLLVHMAPENLPRLNEAGLSWRIAGFVGAITLATPLVFCFGPIVGTLRSALMNHLRGEGRSSTQSKRQRAMMSGAVIVQFSLAFVLLTTAGLLLRSFIKASSVNPGFQPQHVVSMRIALPATTYKTQAQFLDLFDRLLARLSTVPGVRQVGAISDLPMDSSSNVLLSAEGRRGENERVDTLFCLGNALGALRVSLLNGRLLQPDDSLAKRHVAVISEGLANRFWPNENPIGRRIKFGVDDPVNDEPWLTVVGVIKDVKAKLTSTGPRMAIFTTPTDWVNSMNVIVRTSSDPALFSQTLRHEVGQLDPDLPTGSIRTIEAVLEESLSAERFRTWLMTCFAVAAMLLATFGIAGLLAYNAAQRVQEFGVRIALGANRRDLFGLMLGHSFHLSAAGISVGLIVSAMATRALSALLYDTSPLDLATFASVSIILLLVAMTAALIPAWQVVHADPIAALRAE